MTEIEHTRDGVRGNIAGFHPLTLPSPPKASFLMVRQFRGRGDRWIVSAKFTFGVEHDQFQLGKLFDERCYRG